MDRVQYHYTLHRCESPVVGLVELSTASLLKNFGVITLALWHLPLGSDPLFSMFTDICMEGRYDDVARVGTLDSHFPLAEVAIV